MANIKDEVIKNLYQRCKCCLENEHLKEMWAEYQRDGEIEVYGEMLKECYDFPCVEQDMHLEHICEKCIERLRSSLSFRRDILAAKEVLDQLIKDHTKEFEIKTELKKDEEVDLGIYKNEQEDEERLDTEHGEYAMDESVSDECSSSQVEYLMYDDNDDDDDDEEYKPEETEMQVEFLEEDNEAETTVKRKWPKKKKKADRNKTYKQYTQGDLEQAVKMVLSNKMSRSEASEKYSVPIKTLGFKIRQREMDDSAGEGPTEKISKQEKNRKKNPQVSNKIKHYENIRSILLSSNATPIKGHWGKGYACCFCEEQFSDPKDLKTHTLSEHDDETKAGFMKGKSTQDFCVKLDITDLQCVICKKYIETLDELMKHIETKHYKIIYNDIPNQIIPFKFDTERLQCVVCEKQFEFFKLLNEHMNEHYSNYECKECDRKFITQTTLRCHAYRHKSGEFPCQHCSKVFETNIRKVHHERVVHKLNSRAHRCGYCRQRFADSVAKNKHENITHGVEKKVYKCQACDLKFIRLYSLKNHTQTYHLLNLPHTCSECGKGFYKKKDLDRHYDAHAGLKFQCHICSKGYTRPEHLKRHVKLKHNTGEE